MGVFEKDCNYTEILEAFKKSKEMKVDNRIRELRQSMKVSYVNSKGELAEKKMSKEEFATTVGLSRGTIASLENGIRKGSKETFVKIALTFNVSVDWLMKIDEKIATNSKEDIIHETLAV